MELPKADEPAYDRNKSIADKSADQSDVNMEREAESYGIRIVRTGLNKQGYESGFGYVALGNVLDVLRARQGESTNDNPDQLTLDQGNS